MLESRQDFILSHAVVTSEARKTIGLVDGLLYLPKAAEGYRRLPKDDVREVESCLRYVKLSEDIEAGIAVPVSVLIGSDDAIRDHVRAPARIREEPATWTNNNAETMNFVLKSQVGLMYF